MRGNLRVASNTHFTQSSKVLEPNSPPRPPTLLDLTKSLVAKGVKFAKTVKITTLCEFSDVQPLVEQGDRSVGEIAKGEKRPAFCLSQKTENCLSK